MSSYDYSTLYTILPNNLTKDKLIDLMKEPSIEKALLTLHVTTETHFLLLKNLKNIMHGQNVCDTLTFMLDNIFIRFATKLYRQVVWISMDTNCAPVVADLFLFCYERVFMVSLSNDIIDAFNNTCRYLNDILNINNVYFINNDFKTGL